TRGARRRPPGRWWRGPRGPGPSRGRQGRPARRGGAGVDGGGSGPYWDESLLGAPKRKATRGQASRRADGQRRFSRYRLTGRPAEVPTRRIAWLELAAPVASGAVATADCCIVRGVHPDRT